MDPYQQPQNQPSNPLEPNNTQPIPSPQPSIQPSYVQPEQPASQAPVLNDVPFNQFGQQSADTVGTQPTGLPSVPAPVPAPAEDPGKTMGIIGIVLIFFFAPAAIILGIISRKKSKAAGHSTTLGTVALVGGIVAAILNILAVVAFFSLMAAGVNELNKQGSITVDSSTSSGLSGTTATTPDSVEEKAKQVQKLAEAYKVHTGDYPQRTSDFSKHADSTPPENLTIFSAIRSSNSVTYTYCSAGAAQVTWLGASREDVKIAPIGSASATEPCML